MPKPKDRVITRPIKAATRRKIEPLSQSAAAGKGSKPRPVDLEKYAENYEKIFRKEEPKEEGDSLADHLKEKMDDPYSAK